jgi:hypothetical protein
MQANYFPVPDVLNSVIAFSGFLSERGTRERSILKVSKTLSNVYVD